MRWYYIQQRIVICQLVTQLLRLAANKIIQKQACFSISVTNGRLKNFIIPYLHCPVIHQRLFLYKANDSFGNYSRKFLLDLSTSFALKNYKQRQFSSVHCNSDSQRKPHRRGTSNHDQESFLLRHVHSTLRGTIHVDCRFVHIHQVMRVTDLVTIGRYQSSAVILAYSMHDCIYYLTYTGTIPNRQMMTLQEPGEPFGQDQLICRLESRIE